MSSSRAARCSGSTARSSAAPSAANAIARGHGDRSCAARSNWMIADWRDPGDVTVRGGGPEPPDAPPPGVLQGRLVDPTARAVHPVAAGAVESLRLVQEPQRDSGETVQRRPRVGFSGGDDKHPGHVVGAVAVLGPRLGETGRARRCRDGPSAAADGRIPEPATSWSYQCPPLGEDPMRQAQIRTRDDRPGHLGRQSAGLGRHVAGEPRLRQHPAQGGRQRIRVVVADDDARSAAEELDGVRERGGHDWPAARDGVDQHTGGDLIGRVVGQDDDGGGLDEVGQHRNVAVARVEGHRIRDAAAPRLFDSGIAVRLAVGGQHLRVRSAGNQVPRPAGQIS